MQTSETPVRLSNEAVVNEVVAQAAREYEYRFLSFSFLSPCAFAPRLAHAGRGFFF